MKRRVGSLLASMRRRALQARVALPALPALGARDRRTLAIGLTAVAAVLGIGRGLPALRAWEEAERLALVRQLAHERHLRTLLAGAEDPVRAVPGARVALIEAEEALLAATSAPGAAALLGETMSALADDAGVTIASLDASPVEEALAGDVSDGWTVRARLAVTGTSEQALDLLWLLEDAEAPLSITGVELRVADVLAPVEPPDAVRLTVMVETRVRTRSSRPVRESHR